MLDDPSAHLLIARAGEGNFIVVGERDIHFSVKGKVFNKKIMQQRPGLQSSYLRRTVRDHKEDLFLVNEFG